MDRVVDLEPSNMSDLRVAIIGNSNSVMRESFVRVLEAEPRIKVVNKSIGSTPNLVLLDFLALEPDLDYDFIIIETAVMDYVQANSLYTRERAQETLEFFITCVRAKSTARIIILTIPTRYGLLAPDAQWQEPLYKDTAARFGIPILDGFRLIRHLLGSARAHGIGLALRRAEQLVAAFGLPAHLVQSIAWRNLRDRNVISNSLGVFGFVDHAHVSCACHSLLGVLLRTFICSAPTRQDRGHADEEMSLQSVLKIVQPDGGSPIGRASSLISRDLVRLRPGEAVRYRCPPGYRAYGLLINDPATTCFLQLESPGGSTTFDMRLAPKSIDWIAVIVPILDVVGDGNVIATIVDQPRVTETFHCLHGTVPVSDGYVAELGGLILLNPGWRNMIPPAQEAATGAFHIEDAPWAKPLIAEACVQADRVIRGVEADGQFVDDVCSQFASGLLAQQNRPLSPADQARLLLALGLTEQLTSFLAIAVEKQAGNGGLETMHAAVQAHKAEDEVSPRELLDRAVSLVGTGASNEAEVLLLEGMARFAGEIGFFIERAWISHRGKDWPEAIQRWQLVTDSFPRHPVGYRGLSMCLRESGRPADADTVIDAAMTRFPELQLQL